MLKILLYALLIYLGYRVVRFVSKIQIKKRQDQEFKPPQEPDLYERLDIQDAEFKDLEEQ